MSHNTNSEPIIQVENFSFRYPDKKNSALQDVSFSIDRGEGVLLLGPIGSGKTTLLLAILGLIPKMITGEFSGSIRIAQEEISKLSLYRIASEEGLVLQDPEAQIATLRVDDEVAFGMENLSVDETMLQDRVTDALSSLGIRDKSDVETDQLSYGEKQKVVIASILAMNTEILLLDEPTSNLDSQTTHDFFRLLKSIKLSRQKTIVMVEHRLDPIITLFDRVIVLGKNGRIEIIAAPQELFKENNVQKLDSLGIWLPSTLMTEKTLKDNLWKSTNKTESVSRSVSKGRYDDGTSGFEFSGNPLIQITKLSYSYGNGHMVLDKITANIRDQSIHFLLGPNGSGKSTLAKLLTRLLKPPANCILYRGKDLLSIAPKELYSKVGYVFQNPEQQFLTASVHDEVAYGLKHQALSRTEIERRTLEILTSVGLEDFAEASPFRLSGGQKRLLSIATMMLGQEFLIFDEPTYGLDRFATYAVINQAHRLREYGRTILIITHETDLMWRYAEDVTIIEGGRILFNGSKERLALSKEIAEKAGIETPSEPKVSGEEK